MRLSTAPLCLTPEAVSAPTTVLVLVDRSGSTCLTDHGAAPDGGFCAGLSGPGGTSRRLASLESLIDRAANSPDVLLSFVLYGPSPSRVPAGAGSSAFARPDSTLKAQLRAYLDTTTMDDPLADVAFVDGGVTSAQVLFAVPWRSLPGTDAPLPDSDGDGLADAREAELSTNPLVADTDGDGLTQFEETMLGTFPSSPDTDFDGVLDGLEVRAGMDPKAKQPGRDGDGDGVSDVAELLATSNPASGLDAVFRQRAASSRRGVDPPQPGQPRRDDCAAACAAKGPCVGASRT